MAKHHKKGKKKNKPAVATKDSPATAPLSTKDYERELFKLQIELVKMQDWVKHTGARIVVLFEGRDAAGKGGIIKRILERVSPRVFRLVALPAPTERQKTQMYAQRYIEQLPAGGEVVIFDRSWYNRAGVEHVMGFCTQEEYERFLRSCPAWERDIIGSGIRMIKYWFDISKEEQTRRFTARINDPRKIWKLSPMDLKSHRHWYDYSRARDAMFAATHTPASPWHIVEAYDKRRARLNCIAHFLDAVPYKKVEFNKVKLPKRQGAGGYKEPDYAKMVIKRVY